MKIRLLLGLPLLGIASLTTGCATVTRGTTEVLVVETEPPGAEVSISPEGRNCKTPCSVELKRKRDYVVDVARPGYEPVRVNIVSEIAGAGAAGMAGNLLLGGIIGAGVDAATGATKKLTPNPVKINLVRIDGSAVPAVVPAAAPAAPAATPAVAPVGVVAASSGP